MSHQLTPVPLYSRPLYSRPLHGFPLRAFPLRAFPLLLAGLVLASVPSALQDDEPTGEADDAAVLEELRATVLAIQPRIEQIRGLAFKRPVELRVATQEDLREYMQGFLEELTSPAELQAQDTIAKLTGLLPADQDLLGVQTELLESQVAGYYDPRTDTFSLMDSLVGSGLAKVILAHELTHALDDQHYDLHAGLEARTDDSDALWAYQAVVEGSATAVMNVWTREQLLSGESAISSEDLEEAGSMGADVLERMPPFLWKPMLGAYLRGSAFLARTDSVLKASMSPKAPPQADFDRAFREPPRSSEQVLHPETYWDEEALDQPEDVTLATGALPEGVAPLYEDTFGELQLGFVVQPTDERAGVVNQLALLGTKYTSPAVTGWGGDRYVLLGVGEARALVARTRWDSEDEAAEFAAALGEPALQAHLAASLVAFAEAKGLPTLTWSWSQAEGRTVSFALSSGLADDAARALVQGAAEALLGTE